MKYDVEKIGEMCEQIVNRLVSDCDFDKLLNGEVDCDEWLDETEVFDDLYITCGATRGVIVPDNCDFVFKFCFNRNSSTCADEALIYKTAKACGFEHHFAWTEKVYTYYSEECGDVDFYAMEKCDANDDAIADASYNYHCDTFIQYKGWDSEHLTGAQMNEMRDEVGSYDYDSSNGMLEYCHSVWDDADEVIDFLYAIGVNDVHSGNWGYRNGELVLIDYAGFHSNINYDYAKQMM